MILFGSRVDLYVPAAVAVRVSIGERVRAGESVIGAYR
jgi:phosphatidylserine decarboxylase